MYLFGIFGSVATAKLTYYFNPVQVLKTTILISIPGIGLMYITDFWIVTLGLAILTFDFFVIHVICNRIVSEYNVMKRSVTISIYLLAYYLGSSFWGSATGIVLDKWGWQYFLAGLIVLLLILYLFAKQGEKVTRKKEAILK